MKKRLNLKKLKSYIKELSIITISVLMALIISNVKESRQERRYYNASLETIRTEIELNHASLQNSVTSHNDLMDSVIKYMDTEINIADILERANGLQGVTPTNTSLEFYKRNHINRIDFELMTSLMNIETTINMIDTKMNKLLDFLYPNLYSTSLEDKSKLITYLSNVLNSEEWLLQEYESFIAKNHSIH